MTFSLSFPFQKTQNRLEEAIAVITEIKDKIGETPYNLW